MKFKKGIFISYSHVDLKWLEQLLTFLKPVLQAEKIIAWSDQALEPGESWKERLDQELKAARVAVLLVSSDFLASEFIAKYELPQILDRNKSGAVTVFWIAIRPSLYEHTPLANIQSANDPSKPLSSLKSSDRELEIAKIVQKIAAVFSANQIANSLAIIDEFSWQAKELVEGKSIAPGGPTYSVVARQQDSTIRFERGDQTVETITKEDFEKLSPQEQQLIRVHERAMEELFDRWTETYPKRHAEDEAVKTKALTKLITTKTQLCAELRAILDFLASKGKQLHDHYDHVRFICSQPNVS
jgi:hypothetical protein